MEYRFSLCDETNNSSQYIYQMESVLTSYKTSYGVKDI